MIRSPIQGPDEILFDERARIVYVPIEIEAVFMEACEPCGGGRVVGPHLLSYAVILVHPAAPARVGWWRRLWRRVRWWR